MSPGTPLDILKKSLPGEIFSTDPGDLESYGRDWLKNITPDPSLIAFPRTEEEMIKIVSICHANGVPIVPSGGRTGLSGGATASSKEVVISLDKLNKIIELDPIDRTVKCQAGVITQRLQEEAAKHGLYFPVDFASKGSSQIGGNVATNAGGIRVIRYGNIRDWVIGLKAVTGTGAVLDLNKRLFKNQTGFDLKSLLIGSEGTLAIITEVTLRLVSQPRDLIRVIGGLDKLEEVLELLRASRAKFPTLSAFEYFSSASLNVVLKHHKLPDPLGEKSAHYILVEFEDEQTTLLPAVEQFFFDQIEKGVLKDGVISRSIKQSNDFMQYRELIPEALNAHYSPHKNDISVPVGTVPAFVTELEKIISTRYPDFGVAIFGHVGDGNLHINIMKPASMEKMKFLTYCKDVDKEVFGLVQSFGGSISAEHGIGLLKKDFLRYSRSEQEIDLMRSIKKVFDPKGILNRGKIFD